MLSSEAPRAPLRDQDDLAQNAMRRAVDNLARLQGKDGAWPGDYGGPLFLLPMYVALCHATGRVASLGEVRRQQMIAYLTNVQRPDGSLGLHADASQGSMFCTSLGYVALRILGVPSDRPSAVSARHWIREHGTPLYAPAWAKFVLCLLGLCDFRAIHPVLPELWLLPRWLPLHPGRLWCHCRQVYLPMAWLYGKRATIPGDELTKELRGELYGGTPARIDWARHRDTLSTTDAYRASTIPLRVVNRALALYERFASGSLRSRALGEVFEHVHYEDEVTGYLDIGPVNKVLNAFVHYFNEPEGEAFRRAFAACDAYLWQGRDGLKMQGYNSSKLWDTAFAVQAIASAPHAEEHKETLGRAHDYLRDNQILEDVPDAERHYRHRSRGGWPFSSREHGWPITDCTAEGLKAVLALEGRCEPAVPDELLRAAVELILSWQNDDGGFATYERQRGGNWLELLNPSQVFGDIMVDYSYVECTSACIQALVRARGRFGNELDRAADRAIDRAALFLRKKQRADGSFEGSWGVCFTYGTWFGVSGLCAAGIAPDDPAIADACRFLLAKQRACGGWGEHGDSCRERRYIEAERASVVQTAWALSALVRARHPDSAAKARAARMLISRQMTDGSWPEEPLVGVFNRTCLINYDNYRHYFPLWALAEWADAES
jgi:squalene/oxidosqualene cyclase-like protein